jgi:hypothetical protein
MLYFLWCFSTASLVGASSKQKKEVWIVRVRCVLISYVNLMSQCYQTSCCIYSKYTVLMVKLIFSLQTRTWCIIMVICSLNYSYSKLHECSCSSNAKAIIMSIASQEKSGGNTPLSNYHACALLTLNLPSTNTGSSIPQLHFLLGVILMYWGLG